MIREMIEEQLVRDGMSRRDAAEAARRQFGNEVSAVEDSSDEWPFAWLSTLFRDIRFAARVLRKRPGLTLTVVLIAGLGVGANTAIVGVLRTVMLKPLGLINTYGGAIVPAMASVFGIFVVRQFARGIPDDLLEAARIDGASEFRIFLTIVVPLLTPVLVTLAVFSFLGSWNDFMWPLIVLTDDALHTLPVALAGLSREHVHDSELMMAGSVVTILPVLVVFLALQRQYMAGLMAGGVKG